MAEHGSRPAAGGREWKFDPLHQTTGPVPFSRARARLFWGRVACPVLYVEGADSPLRLQPDDKADRLALLRARRVTMDGVAHHPHLEQPEPFTRPCSTSWEACLARTDDGLAGYDRVAVRIATGYAARTSSRTRCEPRPRASSATDAT